MLNSVMGRRVTLVMVAVIVAAAAALLWLSAYSGVSSRGVTDPEHNVSPATENEVAITPLGLAIPVAGVKGQQLLDTYTQSRAASAGSDDGIDIFASAGRPVVAAAPGTVERLSVNESGDGLTVYLRSEDRRHIYYYAHLQSYASGLREGQRVERAQVIGRVGSTGDASPRAPHLHFGIKQMAPGERWWQGTPVNPYPLLTGGEVGAQPGPGSVR